MEGGMGWRRQKESQKPLAAEAPIPLPLSSFPFLGEFGASYVACKPPTRRPTYSSAGYGGDGGGGGRGGGPGLLLLLSLSSPSSLARDSFHMLMEEEEEEEEEEEGK